MQIGGSHRDGSEKNSWGSTVEEKRSGFVREE